MSADPDVLPVQLSDAVSAGRAPLRGAAIDWLAGGPLLIGFAALFLPTLWDLTHGLWKESNYSHVPIVVAVVAWLLYRRREAFASLPAAPSRVAGGLLLMVGLMFYGVGRSQEILRIEVGAMLFVAAALPLYFKGWRGLLACWFPLLFLVFAIPLPNELVIALTAPVKTAVSVAAVWLLSLWGYPVGRSGVVMTVGQYELLVTEACAGLQTMFTLEAVGLLYANVMNHSSALRNVLLAVLVAPVSFAANVIRVTVLAMITYHLGDAAGRGFLHGFAGLLLFAIALVMLMAIDHLLGRALQRGPRAR